MRSSCTTIRYGIRGLVIDPYNELDGQRRRDTKETHYIGSLLGQVGRGTAVPHVSCMRDIKETEYIGILLLKVSCGTAVRRYGAAHATEPGTQRQAEQRVTTSSAWGRAQSVPSPSKH